MRHHTCDRTQQIILAVILPPLGVFLERGCGADLLINILLTILGYMWVPSTAERRRALED